jgi:asparagine synthetase B (glutamine-hydrolysing)
MVQVPSLGVLNRSISHRSNTLDTKSSSVILLRQYLVKSLKLRVLNVPAPPGLGQKQDVRIAVLFSGGLDCTVLARMAHDLLPPEQHIDLINVAFENPRVVRASKIVARSKMQVEKVFEDPCTLEMTDTIASTESSVEISPFECCPDRETGRKTFQELKAVCPDRFWRFIAVCSSIL